MHSLTPPLAALLALLLAAGSAHALTLHVAPDGDDRWAGRPDQRSSPSGATWRVRACAEPAARRRASRAARGGVRECIVGSFRAASRPGVVAQYTPAAPGLPRAEDRRGLL